MVYIIALQPQITLWCHDDAFQTVVSRESEPVVPLGSYTLAVMSTIKHMTRAGVMLEYMHMVLFFVRYAFLPARVT